MEPENNKKKVTLERVKERLKNSLLHFKELLTMSEDTDVVATMTSIKKGVEFRGINIWILFFAIIIASVGLNVNSTAVIIGAMLISPLMGPINGIGLAVGTFDMSLLRKSLRNFSIMVIISIIASTLYFILSPLSDAQSELLARTTPTIFDVLIAFFGGFAGIVAASRKEQPFTVISGVAIATALMPPLCTAGFGIATLQFNYFFGAFYLFFINSFFIALATVITVRYLHFPIVKFVNKKKARNVKRGITFFALIVMIPSCFIAINVVQETAFNSNVIKYITEIQKQEFFSDVQLVNYKKEYHKKNSTLTLFLIGKELSAGQIDTLRNMMINDFNLNSTQLKIKHTGDVFDVNMQADVLENIISAKDTELKNKDLLVTQLNLKIDSIQKNETNYADKTTVIGQKYKRDILKISILDVSYYNTETTLNETIPTIFIVWKPTANVKAVVAELESWCPILLDVEKIKIVSQE